MNQLYLGGGPLPIFEALYLKFPALSFPLFRSYWFGSFASVGATQLVILGQGWLIFKISGSALELGYLGAAASIPTILLAVIGGAMADRFDKRVLLMLCSASNVLLLSCLALLDFLEVVQVWHVLTIALLISFVTGIEWPTRSAFFPHLIKRDGLLSAVALNAFIWQSTRMAIPAFGGLIIALWDTWSIFALAALGYCYMFIVILTMNIHIPGNKQHSTWAQAREGIHFIVHHETFGWLILLSMVCMFFGNSYMQIMPVFIDLMGSDEQGYGTILSASGVGSLVGTFLIINQQHSPYLGRVILAGAAGLSICLLGFWLSALYGSFYSAILFTMVSAAFGSALMISSMTVLQMKVTDQYRGRVNGIYSMSYSMVPLGGLFLGMLANSFSAPMAVLLGASASLLFCLFVTLRVPAIRNFDGREFKPSKGEEQTIQPLTGE